MLHSAGHGGSTEMGCQTYGGPSVTATNDVDMMALDETLDGTESKEMLHRRLQQHAVMAAGGERFNLLPVAGCETEEEEGMQLGDIANDARPLSTGSGGSSGSTSMHVGSNGGGSSSSMFGEVYLGEDALLSPYDMSSGMSMMYDTVMGTDLAAVATAATAAAANGVGGDGWGNLVGVA